MEPTIPTYTDESDCAPLTPAQIAARDEAWPEYAPGAGSLAGDIRAKLAVAAFVATDALVQFMDECRAFLAEMEARSETFTLPGGVPLEMIPVPGVGLVGKCPVTQRQWEALMGANPSHFRGADRPVEQVSWYDCQDFCVKISAHTGREFRLPTAAEWEDAIAEQPASLETGWFFENSDEQTHPVGQKLPNVFGLYDMHGNIWEWCEGGGTLRPLRGGSWLNVHSLARPVVRYLNRPAFRNSNLGFRVLLRPPSARAAQWSSLAAVVEQLSSCDYRNEAGPLALNSAFIQLREGARDEGCLAKNAPCDDCAWCRMFGGEK